MQKIPFALPPYSSQLCTALNFHPSILQLISAFNFQTVTLSPSSFISNLVLLCKSSFIKSFLLSTSRLFSKLDSSKAFFGLPDLHHIFISTNRCCSRLLFSHCYCVMKENVEELSLEKSQLMERGEELMEENSKLPMKTDVVVKLKAETEELNSEIAKRRSKMKEVITNGVHTFLNDLSSVTSKSTVKVRITRLWDTWNIPKWKGLISTDMVLMDEKHNYIHGTIPSKFANLFKNVLQEGKMYVIDNFTVAKNKRRYVIVENNTSMLQFYGSTTFKPEEYDDGKIPRYIFEFVHFKELHKRFDDQAHADVIGVIIDITPIEEKTTAHGEVDMMSLYLRGESGDILKVTLWDDYVTMFDKKLEKYKHATLKPNVAIFTSILVKQYKGEFYVQSSRSTTIFINIDIPKAIELAQSSKAANVMDEIVNLPFLVVHRKIDKMKTISEILGMAASGNNMNAVYHCVATVDDILVKNGWYYVSCSECRKTWSPTETDFQCEHCKVDVAYPKIRFRLELQVKDPTDSTIFVLFDEVVEQVVQVKCGDLTSNLENGNVKDSELPGQILNIIGTKHVFQVKMSSYFESRGRQSFTPNKILKSIVKVDKEDTMDYICSSSSGPPTVNMPILAQKRKRLILHSSSESDNMDQNIVQDLDD
ncbi:replication protein A 70 kDa DNA-binding subunit B [Trifolium repens]|nr:replication protein A 70 kDa DNA-binding subunit B [Trifolium repens]